MPAYNPLRNTASNRRGITLLATMSMIVLFMLLGTAFVMVSARFLRTSKYQAIQIEKSGDKHEELLRRAFLDVVRGQNIYDVSAPLRGVDLLSDQYSFGLSAEVEVPNPVAAPGAGQLITVDLWAGSGQRHVTKQNIQLSQIFNAYAGRVFTFISGTAKNISTRVVGYEFLIDPHGTGRNVGRFYLLPNWDEITGNPFTGVVQFDQVIINGRPFDGRGAGGVQMPLSPHTSKDQSYLNRTALRPYKYGFSADQLYTFYLSSGVNESYDAPDFQNPFLAYESVDNFGNPIVIPSFHHPNHVQHMQTYAGQYGLTNADMSSVSLRPAAVPGSVDTSIWRPNLLTAAEVDNNGDGLNDSVWIDIGYPVQTDKNGRTYKPLFAFKIIDLDSRLNVNAHGTTWDAEDDRQASSIAMLAMPNNAVNDNLPRGMGYGPAEISLSPAMPAANYQALVASRYGNDNVPGGVNRDSWSHHKLFGHPPTSVGGFYSTPMDVFGRFVTGFPNSMDGSNPAINFVTNAANVPYTMPSLDVNGSGFPDEISNSPYEMVLGNNQYTSDTVTINTTSDNPYSAKEMERVLRRFDRDSRMLPGRLTSLLSNSLTGIPYGDQLFTHASYEVPAIPKGLNNEIDDLVELHSGGPLTLEQRKAYQMLLLSWDLQRGLPMDINRPFGNGIDDDGDGFIDEYGANNGEQFMERLPEYYDGIADPDPMLDPLMDHDNDGTSSGDADAYQARELYARHLFVLALTVLSDPNGPIDRTTMQAQVDINGDMAVDDEDIVAIAQWAINVVDFKDADSICTRFSFDLNPFDGWSPNRVVYGVERPELLITEAGAQHDRRTEDRSDEQPNATESPDTYDPNNGGDEDFDSRLIPRASAFIELYNPWTQDNISQATPNELYRGTGGVDLDALAPGGAPVWRLTFVKQTSAGIDPDDPNNTIPANDFNRFVYFTNPTLAGLDTPNARWTNLGVASVQPGQYAVIGSSGIERDLGGGTFGYQTPIGRRQGATEGTPGSLLMDTTRGITLIPANNQVVLRKWDSGAGDIGTETRDGVVAIAINQPTSLGLTDPETGYNPLDPTGAAPVDVGDGLAYPTPYDTPEDYNSGDSAILRTGVTQDYNIVHLQRLANPTEPYNAASNPYLTFDSHWVDLNAYNGVEDDSVDSNITLDGMQELRTVERGWQQGGKNGPPDLVETDRRASRNIWRTEPQNCPVNNTPAIVTDNHIYNYPWDETFGMMNQWYRDTGVPPTPESEVVAFPWLAWNNRPFVSSMELALVPFHRSSQMLDNFTLADEATDPYTSNGRFGHLPNFFGTSAAPNTAVNFYRLLDYVEVPSRFVGTETYFNPNHFTNLQINFSNPNNHGPLFGLNVPFNYVSRYRNPGKININTLAREQVWQGLMGQYSVGTTLNTNSLSGAPATFGIDPIPFDQFLLSRTGNGAVSAFGNPYRFAETSNFVPEYWDNTMATWSDGLVVDGADTGLFRRSTVNPAAAFYDVVSNFPYNDTRRNALPRYLARTRLDNLVTTRSSVFAIWITVGKFEVTHEPDGSLELGAELGIETGDIERHRAFYMFDRSIPVAFEPGENHNVERAIIAETIIE